jgi:hypothetical protein
MELLWERVPRVLPSKISRVSMFRVSWAVAARLQMAINPNKSFLIICWAKIGKESHGIFFSLSTQCINTDNL